MLRDTGLCTGNSPGTSEFPAQMASYAEKVSIWWRHHDHVDIWQVSLQLHCGDTCQIWTGSKVSILFFFWIEINRNGGINVTPPQVWTTRYLCLIWFENCWKLFKLTVSNQIDVACIPYLIVSVTQVLIEFQRLFGGDVGMSAIRNPFNVGHCGVWKLQSIDR